MSPVRTSSLVIETPEGISFTLLLASPITRFLAWIIDFLAIMALNTGLQNALPLLGILGADFAQAAAILGYFVISIGYSITLEWWLRGQTLGKRAVGLRVVDAQGLRLDFSQIVIRNLLRFIDLLPGFYLVGGIASVVDDQLRSQTARMLQCLIGAPPVIFQRFALPREDRDACGGDSGRGMILC